MIKLMLAAGLCAAAGLAHAQSAPSSPSSASVMSGSIDGAGDITLKAPKYNMNLPEVVGAPSKGVDANAVTAYRVSPPDTALRTKPKHWTFNGDGQSVDQRRLGTTSTDAYVQDNYVGNQDVDGYDNFSVAPDN